MTLDEALAKIRRDRDPPEPWLQAIIDETAAEIRAAFEGIRPVRVSLAPATRAETNQRETPGAR